jgi:hypothetical protein
MAKQEPQWLTWINTIPQKDRDGLASVLKCFDVTNHQGLLGFSQAVMVGMIRGDIPPDISKEVRHWAELILTTICSEQTNLGTPEKAHEHILVALQSVAQTAKVVPTYITADIDELEVTPPEQMPALNRVSKDRW